MHVGGVPDPAVHRDVLLRQGRTRRVGSQRVVPPVIPWPSLAVPGGVVTNRRIWVNKRVNVDLKRFKMIMHSKN